MTLALMSASGQGAEGWLAAAAGTNAVFLQQAGLGGVCRGGLRLICAPALVPCTLVLGLTVPFRANPEMAGRTNYCAYAAVQSAVWPVVIVANTVVGTGQSCLETVRGLVEIISCGYYSGGQTRHPIPDWRPAVLALAAAKP